MTWLDGQEIYGTNSSYHLVTDADDAITKRVRDVLVKTYPDRMATGVIGRFPNAALFHAETNVLLRAAKANGGSLAGKTLEVVVNGTMCGNCAVVLPLVAWELGNPTVFFTDFDGVRHMVRDKKITRVPTP